MGNKVVEFASYAPNEAPKDMQDLMEMMQRLHESGAISIEFEALDDGKVKMTFVMEENTMIDYMEAFKNVVMKGEAK